MFFRSNCSVCPSRSECRVATAASDHRVPTAAFCLPRAVPRHPLSRILPSNLRVSILVLFLNRWRSNGYFGYGLVILIILVILVILVILEGLGTKLRLQVSSAATSAIPIRWQICNSWPESCLHLPSQARPANRIFPTMPLPQAVRTSVS